MKMKSEEKALHVDLKGKRPRGKSSLRWEEIQKDALWEDRDRWRGLTVRQLT
jgi:hypothetical protein